MKIYLSLLVLAVSLLVLGCSSDSSETSKSPSSVIKPVLADTDLSVAENSLAGQSVGTVTIVDEGDSVITLFTLTGTGSSLFDINVSGSISVVQSDTLDYETVTYYTLSSTATNSAGVSNSVVIIINIDDVDDAPGSPDADSDGYTVAAGDCNDADELINPGATEVCDAIDNNCDGQVDENAAITCTDGVACTIDSCESGECLHTSDNTLCDDGNQCTDDVCDLVEGCLSAPCSAGTACDDGNPDTVNDICDGSGVCVGTVCTDADGDNVCSADDCDDTNPLIYPGATEVCNGIDDDCDAEIDEDIDLTLVPNATAVCSDGVLSISSCDAGFNDLDGDISTGCEYSCDFLGEEDIPDNEYLDRNCDGIDGDINRAIFVSTTGNDSATCQSLTEPCKSISYALDRAVFESKTDIYIQDGVYDENSSLISGISLYGGFNESWSRTSGQNTKIISSTENFVFKGDGLSNVTIYNLDVEVNSNTFSKYTLMFLNSTDINVIDCKVVSGSGANGINGVNGANGTDGANGANGADGDVDNDVIANGGAGGIGVFNGGIGGPGKYEQSGISGESGAGGASGGAGGLVGNPGQDGGNGSSGIDGSSGSSGSSGLFGTMTVSGLIPINGANGTDGTDAKGGGGGGGGGGQESSFGVIAGTGNAGGGGGSGGQRGGAGVGGVSAGSSIAIYLYQSSNILIQNNLIYTGNGGNAGNAGNGGNGGTGGAGGTGGLAGNGSQIGLGGAGGNGGRGGTGGHGGGGYGGSTIGILNYDSTLTNLSNTFNLGTSGSGGSSGGNSGSAGLSEVVYTP